MEPAPRFRSGLTRMVLSQFSAMILWIWIIGGFPAAVLGEIVRADSPRTARAGRIAFAFLLGVDLLFAAVILSIGTDAPTANMTRGLWWVTIVLAGVPLVLVSGLAVRRGYPGYRRLPLLVATLMTAGLYVVFPLAFTPTNRPPTGLGLWVHEHRLLGVAVLLIPTLILLVNEFRWKQAEAPPPRGGCRRRRLPHRDALEAHPHRIRDRAGVHLVPRRSERRQLRDRTRRCRCRLRAVPLVEGPHTDAQRAQGPGNASKAVAAEGTSKHLRRCDRGSLSQTKSASKSASVSVRSVTTGYSHRSRRSRMSCTAASQSRPSSSGDRW
jgi:hypothetical protein